MAKTSRLVSTVAALALAAPVLAQVAKEGPLDFVMCWGGQIHQLAAMETARFGTYSVSGAVRGADKPFDGMAVECIGTYESITGVHKSKGYCIFQDASGDRIYGTDWVAPEGPAWQYLAGTGKFKGITGSGKVEALSTNAQLRPGTMQACRRVTGTYKMP
jgi:hypothetical protein